jgi:hypothetical protein
MKKQLDALAEEMITEIKDLKDLAKKELPEVAKEYIRFKVILNLVGIFIFGLLFLLSVCAALYGYYNKGYTHSAEDIYTVSFALGIFGVCISPMLCIANIVEYLKFKLQPRRMAIEAVTTLFKGT